MKDLSLNNIKGILLFLLFVILSIIIFLFVSLTLPQLLGFNLTSLYKSILYTIAPISLIPPILYLNQKIGLQLKTSLIKPSIWLIILLTLLGVSAKIITVPLNNPAEFFNCIVDGKLKVLAINGIELSWRQLLSIIGPVLIVPIVEEIFFRKQLLGLFLEKYSPFYSILLSSFLFALMHIRLTDIGTLLVWGIIYGYIYYYTFSVKATIFLHSFCNFSNLFLHYKFLTITGIILLKYVLIMLSGLIILLSVIKYFSRLGQMKSLNNSTPDEHGIVKK